MAGFIRRAATAVSTRVASATRAVVGEPSGEAGASLADARVEQLLERVSNGSDAHARLAALLELRDMVGATVACPSLRARNGGRDGRGLRRGWVVVKSKGSGV